MSTSQSVPASQMGWIIFISETLVFEPQGEAICFTSNGRGYFTVSEKNHQPLYYFAKDISDISDLAALAIEWLLGVEY